MKSPVRFVRSEIDIAIPRLTLGASSQIWANSPRTTWTARRGSSRGRGPVRMACTPPSGTRARMGVGVPDGSATTGGFA